MKYILIFILVVVLITIISILLFLRLHNNKKNKSQDEITIDDIKSKFNNIEYNSDGSPKGGILLSMLNNKDICDNYKYQSNTCFQNIKDCENKIPFNPGDINNLLSRVKKSANTNCFSLDTTYFRIDLPQYVFGPYTGIDMVVGIVLDTQVLFDYIGCMFPIDAGSVSRYNLECYDDNIKDYIDNKNKTPKQNWYNFIQNKDSKILGSCGCGSMSDKNIKQGLTSYENASDYFLWQENKVKQYTNSISNLISNDIINNYWAFGQQPYDKYQWKYWVEAVKKIFDKVNNYGMKFVESQLKNGDGFRENEVDIYVPNNKGVDCADTCEEKQSCSSCDVTEDFKKVFVKSLLGIISVAQDNCSNAPDPSKHGPGGFGCIDNLKCDPNNMNKCKAIRKCNSSSKTDVDTCLKNNCCYQIDDNGKESCYEPTKTNEKCCCSQEFSEKLAKSLADNWNNSDIKEKYGGKKINAYRIRVDDIYNFSYKKDEMKDLDIEQI